MNDDLLITRESILAAMKRRIVRVPIENFGTVCIRSLSGAQRARMADLFRQQEEAKKKGAEELQADLQQQNQKNIQARIVSLVLVTEDGVRIFSDNEADLNTIAEMDATVLDELTNEGMKASGLKPDKVEEQVKNSEPAPVDLKPST
jgi:hypothetical protein